MLATPPRTANSLDTRASSAGPARYEPLARAMAELYTKYSDEELALIVDCTRRGNAIALEHIARVERGDTARDRA